MNRVLLPLVLLGLVLPLVSAPVAAASETSDCYAGNQPGPLYLARSSYRACTDASVACASASALLVGASACATGAAAGADGASWGSACASGAIFFHACVSDVAASPDDVRVGLACGYGLVAFACGRGVAADPDGAEARAQDACVLGGAAVFFWGVLVGPCVEGARVHAGGADARAVCVWGIYGLTSYGIFAVCASPVGAWAPGPDGEPAAVASPCVASSANPPLPAPPLRACVPQLP